MSRPLQRRPFGARREPPLSDEGAEGEEGGVSRRGGGAATASASFKTARPWRPRTPTNDGEGSPVTTSKPATGSDGRQELQQQQQRPQRVLQRRQETTERTRELSPSPSPPPPERRRRRSATTLEKTALRRASASPGPSSADEGEDLEDGGTSTRRRVPADCGSPRRPSPLLSPRRRGRRRPPKRRARTEAWPAGSRGVPPLSPHRLPTRSKGTPNG